MVKLQFNKLIGQGIRKASQIRAEQRALQDARKLLLKMEGKNIVRFIGYINELYFLIIRKREILLVYLPAFINIRMEINFRGFYRGMPKIFLHNPEIF